MAKINESPRQKMISILYLVLLGLVALSIDNSVLESFKNLTSSLLAAEKQSQDNVDAVYKSFRETKSTTDPKAQAALQKAGQVSALTTALSNYLTELEKELASKAGGFTASGEVRSGDDVDIVYRTMIRGDRAEKLKQQITDTRNKILALLPASQRSTLNLSLNAIDPPARGGIKKSWEEVNFGSGIPLVAGFTNIAKVRADNKAAELEAVKAILGDVDRAQINFDNFQAVAVAPTSYVLQGQPYTAEVYLSAFDSRNQPEITVNGQTLAVSNGKGVFRGGTESPGLKSWMATIKVKGTDGSIKTYTTPTMQYQVAQPSATVSADKMNVLYIGLPNPISVSAPGIPRDKIRASMTGGSLTSSGNGSYIARVSGGSEAKVSVSADLGDGKVQSLGTTTFRIKPLPKPVVEFGGKSGGSLPAVAIRQQSRIFAKLADFAFEGVGYNINSFRLVIVRPRADAIAISGSGNVLTGAMTNALKTVTPGSLVVFDNITATGPDNIRKQLNSIAITAN